MTNGNTTASISEEPVWVHEDLIIVPLSKVSKKPIVPTISEPEISDKKSLILNIETTGLKPWEHRITTIGLQDPMMPNSEPFIIMLEDEETMLQAFFSIVAEEGYNEFIGYNLGFDFRFLLLRAMKYQIPCSEFYWCELFDLMQVMAQGKTSFVYNPQKPPSLSDIADFFWEYPKTITDLEMIQAYLTGDLEVVREFAIAQIIRTNALYHLFKYVSITPSNVLASNNTNSFENPLFENATASYSKLTIPEASTPNQTLYKCPNCMAEKEENDQYILSNCDVCGQPLEVIS